MQNIEKYFPYIIWVRFLMSTELAQNTRLRRCMYIHFRLQMFKWTIIIHYRPLSERLSSASSWIFFKLKTEHVFGIFIHWREKHKQKLICWSIRRINKRNWVSPIILFGVSLNISINWWLYVQINSVSFVQRLNSSRENGFHSI